MTRFVIIAILSICSLSLSAQYGELGITGGAANYQGDLSPDLTFQNRNIGLTRGAVGIFGRYNFNRFFNTRGAFTFGNVAGDDRLSNSEDRINRNLRFKTNIYEAAAIIEINLLGYDPVFYGKRFSPYLFFGAAGYYFNPKTDYNGRFIELQPLGTEGQGTEGYPAKYSRWSVAFPVGMGLKLALGDRWTLGVEMGGRKLIHDYLDDVSGTYAPYELIRQTNGEIAATIANRKWELNDSSPANLNDAGRTRGNEKFSDWYYFTTLSISYHIINSNKGVRRGKRSGRSLGCPTF